MQCYQSTQQILESILRRMIFIVAVDKSKSFVFVFSLIYMICNNIALDSPGCLLLCTNVSAQLQADGHINVFMLGLDLLTFALQFFYFFARKLPWMILLVAIAILKRFTFAVSLIHVIGENTVLD